MNKEYEVLEELLKWHDDWTAIHKEPFNWYGAVKAMMAMKDPKRPYNILSKQGDIE